MQDRFISATTAVALFLWPTGFILVLVDLFSRAETGELGLLLAGSAGVLNIRGFFCQQRHRERNAFEIGRDYARAELRSLR